MTSLSRLLLKKHAGHLADPEHVADLQVRRNADDVSAFVTTEYGKSGEDSRV